MIVEPLTVLYAPSSCVTMTTRTPAFLDLDHYFPRHCEFESPDCFRRIQRECCAQLGDGYRDRLPLTDVAYGNDFISKTLVGDKTCTDTGKAETDSGWRVVPVKMGGAMVEAGADMFPHTASLVRNDDRIVTAFFSVLEPQCQIPLHVGYYKGVVRYQLAVVIPKERHRCYICVNQQRYCWKEGHGVLFDDCFPHHVYNQTDETRVILYMDVLRTMPQPMHAMNRTIMRMAAKSKRVKDENGKLEHKLKLAAQM